MASPTFVPSEMRPPPSLLHSDDEDSFEVLGKSMSVDMESLLSSKNEPVASRILQDAEQLLEDAQKSNFLSRNETSTLSAPSFLIGDVNKAPSTASHCSSHEEVQQHIEAILQENERLKRTISQNNESMKLMKEQLSQVAEWQQEVQQIYQGHKNKFTEAKLYIDNLKLENARLRTDAEKFKKIKELTESEMLSLKQQLRGDEAAPAPSDNSEEYLNKIKNLEDALNNLNLEHFSVKQENEKLKSENNKSSDFSGKMVEALEEKLKQRDEQIQKLELERTVFQQKRQILEDDIGNLQAQLAQSVQRENKLSDEIERLNKELNEAKINPEELAHLRQQLMNSQMKITRLEQDLKDNKLMLETKQKEMEEAEKLINEMQAQKDDIFALNAQLDLYKNDYEAEKAHAQQLQQMRDEVVNQYQNVQRRNEELHEELQLMRERGFVLHSQYTPRASGTGTVPRTGATPTAPRENNGFHCPKCGFGFRDLQSCQNHVDRCLELDEVLP